ncbi:arabinan endo-1,5-alpha-L-arabinosidase [Sphingobacterium allocomposti]|uniref:Arabinan endo-1,5-alpha-L-arabinosidase n=1 Tax=Sphingobacterium allocomposti TaxID=415956 RepID=A0A5S5D533_9SPHI|nr:family 43 glycosylhydrolase [Sphingobacterium composti Yoo et al. 2007 non Ten et al. 2007]TYP91051.1 arabinan endo-1,5-alpha-L-arabinosidase [Sphingobacterium composti Yoo et al. 2007 non Ten et al. 2007]HLS96943.1 family 43 glycosylhydrolase [Sphingobacterium sp.]
MYHIKRRYIFWTFLCLLFFCVCCRGGRQLGVHSADSYVNPVFEPILADPTLIRDPHTGYFYAYGTQDDWGDGQGQRLMPIIKSKNLMDWEYVGEVFQDKPTWKDGGGLWAPDANIVEGRYYLYYAYSKWGDSNPGIGLAIAGGPEGPFEDQGMLFDSENTGVPNSIDPAFFQEGSKKYLVWGSFGEGPNQGIHLIELSADGRRVVDVNRKIQLAAGDWEAPMIHKKGGYYYLFGSKGSCCEGADSQYKVWVARSSALEGPYVDKEGEQVTQRGRGALLLEGNDLIAGPGHHTRLIRDDDGQDWFLYHAIWKDNPKVRSGASRRTLMLDKLIWENGWPRMETQNPSHTERVGPRFFERRKQ